MSWILQIGYYGILIFFAGGKSYSLKCTVFDEDRFYMGTENETIIRERWCHYELNGVKGWGCSEWAYLFVHTLHNSLLTMAVQWS